MFDATKTRLAAVLAATWKGLVALHRNEVGAVGDQPDKDAPGGTAAAAATADDDAGPVTNDSLYPEGGEAGTDKGGKPAAKKDGEGEGGAGGAKGDDDKDKTKPDAQWDAERQRRDQEHANERRALVDQLRASQDTNQKLLDRLEAAAKPKAGSEADEDLKELDDAIAAQAKVSEALSEDSDPADLVRAQRQAVLANQALAKAIRKVRASSGNSPALEALRKQVADTQAELDELRGEGEGEAQARANEKRIGRFSDRVAALDKQYGPHLHNPANAIAVKRILAAGYNGLPPEDPRANPPPEDVELLAIELAYREAKDALDTKKPKGGGKALPAADSGAGGGAAGGGRPKGRMTNKEYLRSVRRR